MSEQTLLEWLGPLAPPSPKPGESAAVCRGLSVRRNIRNPFLVATLRYEADPAKDPLNESGLQWLLREQQDMGCHRICRTCDKLWAVADETCPDCADETELVLSNRWRREYEIDYGAQSGSYVFDAFSRSRNVTKPFRIPASWRRWRAIDHGWRNPTGCIWVAVDPDRNAWVYAEHYEAGQTTDHHAREIHKKTQQIDGHVFNITPSDLRLQELVGWEPTKEFLKKSAMTYQTIGDPSMANRTAGEAKTIQQRYSDHGIYIAKANRSWAGLETINAMFSAGTLTIFDTCENLIREIENLVWAEHSDPTRNKKEVPVDRDDHLTDCLRYWANAFAPPAREGETPQAPAITSDERAAEDRRRFQERHERPATHDDILEF